MRNDDSVVLEVRYGGVSVVLPGDIGMAVEPAVSAALGAAGWLAVKAPHHGSAGSSSAGFLRSSAPCLAVVSAGRSNPFGHPAPEIVDRYRDVGARVVNTGRGGAVVLETDGRRVEVWQGGRQVAADCARRPH